MAIYHLNAKVISRGKGKSATAAAAYRAGEKITDLRTGLTFDYSRKRGVDATEIIAPAQAPDWVGDRSRLWNEVELFETRKNSRLAREFNIALPVELGHEAKRELVRDFVREQFVSQGLVADVAFHDINSHNPHVHIMLTTRTINTLGFGAKERDLDKKDFLVKLRESWSVHANRILEQAGEKERIDHRTLEEQGINRIPQIHKGPQVAAMMERGIPTEREEAYLSIEVANQQIEALERQLAATMRTIEQEEAANQRAAGEKLEGDRLATGEIDFSVQVVETTPDRQLEPEVALTEELAADRNERDERERVSATRTEPSNGLDQIIDSFRASSQRAEELGERLSQPSRKTREDRRELTEASREGENKRQDSSNANRETTDLRNNPTDSNQSAEARTREFQRLEERARSSALKNRKAGKSTVQGLGAIAAQLGEKIQQFAQSIRGDSEDTEQRQAQSVELARGSDRPQANRTAQGNLDDPTVHESSHLGTQPHQPTQQRPAARHQGQSQQQRDSSLPNREEVRQVKPTQPPKPKPAPQPKPQPLSLDEVNQIFLTATEAVQRYGREWDKKTTFNNPYYQIQKFSVFETYGYRSYLTLDALDGRGRLLTLKGQNFHPANLKVQENRLQNQDVKKFAEIQAALDYLQQVRQLFEDAKAILLKYGERDKRQPYKGYGTLEGKKYAIAFDSQSLRIMTKDGRGEILNYPSESHPRHPEAKAKANFTVEDVELFRNLAKQIEEERREAERRRQKEQELKRQRGKGLER